MEADIFIRTRALEMAVKTYDGKNPSNFGGATPEETVIKCAEKYVNFINGNPGGNLAKQKVKAKSSNGDSV